VLYRLVLFSVTLRVTLTASNHPIFDIFYRLSYCYSDWVIVKSLRPHIKASVVQHKADVRSVADILELAKLAEAVTGSSDEDTGDASKMRQLMDEVRAGREEVQQLTTRMARMTVSSAQSRSPTLRMEIAVRASLVRRSSE